MPPKKTSNKPVYIKVYTGNGVWAISESITTFTISEVAQQLKKTLQNEKSMAFNYISDGIKNTKGVLVLGAVAMQQATFFVTDDEK